MLYVWNRFRSHKQPQFNFCEKNVQKIKQEKSFKLKEFQSLEFYFSNSRIFKDIQVLYELCY